MISINNILVPFVDSPSAIGALKTAVKLCQIHNAKLHVIHVLTEKSNENVLDRIKEVCTKENTVFTFIERSGSIHKEITKAEKEIGIDLIVMGAYGKSGWQQFWVGSNAFKVISTSHCPVLTLQNDLGTFTGFSKIMLPLDDSDETRQKVNWVAKLAKGFDAEVLIFNTTKVKGEDTRVKLAQYATQIENILQKDGIRTSFDESYGNNIAEDCIKFAQLHNCDLITIMTETEHTNSFYMGTYAQQLVSKSPIPVLTIHARSVAKLQSLN
ncbi:MAG: universal stress protein [Bacteroidetes bacterium]|nr:universal stress protein [Bacteroidota bacterium]